MRAEIPCPNDCGGAVTVRVQIHERIPASHLSPAEPADIDVLDLVSRWRCECEFTDRELEQIPKSWLWEAVE